ncbi:MAG: YbaN family protein [Chloroflexi bacterium]|nr:YbaN family protein [Chloroflexota bacterium]
MEQPVKRIKTNQQTRILLIIAGFLFIIIGIIGIFLPVLPTTPFLLLATACFARSSKRFYSWLINNRLFGAYIKSYREKKVIPLKVKLFTITFLWTVMLITVIFAVDLLWIRILLILIAFFVTLHILSLRNLKSDI